MVRLQAGRKLAAESALKGVVVLTSNDDSVEALEIDAAKGRVPEPRFGEGGGSLLAAAPMWRMGSLIPRSTG